MKESRPPVLNESPSPAYDEHVAEEVILDEKEEKKKMSIEVSRGVLKKHFKKCYDLK